MHVRCLPVPKPFGESDGKDGSFTWRQRQCPSSRRGQISAARPSRSCPQRCLDPQLFGSKQQRLQSPALPPHPSPGERRPAPAPTRRLHQRQRAPVANESRDKRWAAAVRGVQLIIPARRPAAASSPPPAPRFEHRPPPLQSQARQHLLSSSLCVLSCREYGGQLRLLAHDAEVDEEEEVCVGRSGWQLQPGTKSLRGIKTTTQRAAEVR